MGPSIYRGFRVRAWDTDATSVHAPKKQGTDTAEDLSHLRRAQPLEKLLPRTVDWLAALPSEMRPNHLANEFGRIANQLCLSWNDPVGCGKCFADLLTDRRGRRQGFPDRVLKELHTLRAYYAYLHPSLDGE